MERLVLGHGEVRPTHDGRGYIVFFPHVSVYGWLGELSIPFGITGERSAAACLEEIVTLEDK